MASELQKKIFALRQSFLRPREPALSQLTSLDQLISKLISTLKEGGQKRALLILPTRVLESTFFQRLKEKTIVANLQLTIFPADMAHPTVSHVEQVLHHYFSFTAEAIIAIGGTSVINLAKAVKARVINQDKNIYKLEGLTSRKRHETGPALILIPADLAGSEANFSAYISDYTEHKKFLLIDQSLLANSILYCQELILTATDKRLAGSLCSALITALEAHLSLAANKKAKADAEAAILQIDRNLSKDSFFLAGQASGSEEKYQAIKKLLMASFLAGKSSRLALAGYATALNHALEIQYGLSSEEVSPTSLLAILGVYRNELLLEKELGPDQKQAGIEALQVRNGLLKKLEEMVNRLMDRGGFDRKISCLEAKDIPVIVQMVEEEVADLYSVSYKLNTDQLTAMLGQLVCS